MGKTVFFLVCSFMLCLNNAYGELHYKGAFDEDGHQLYFTGLDYYRWSGNKNKEYEHKYNNLYVYDLSNKTMRRFYSGTNFLRDVSLSCDTKLIGVINETININTQKQNNEPETLIIFNTKGEKVLTLAEHVQEYVWYPGGDKIIYMTGLKRRQGDEEIIASNGVWIYDMPKNEKQRILEKGWDLKINCSENSLYFWDGNKTIKYELSTGKKIETALLKDKEYSSDGRYYVFFSDPGFYPPYWSSFRIYDTQKDTILPPEQIGFVSERNPFEYFWGKESGVLIFIGSKSRTEYEKTAFIYHIEHKKLIKQLDGLPVGVNKSKTKLILYKDGGFYTELIPSNREQ